MQKPDEVYEREFKVAGVSFYQDAIIQVPGVFVLSLEREPRNKFDKNAVKVFCDDHHVGYVPAHFAKTLSKKLDAGADIEAEFMMWNTTPDNPTIGITIKVKEI